MEDQKENKPAYVPTLGHKRKKGFNPPAFVKPPAGPMPAKKPAALPVPELKVPLQQQKGDSAAPAEGNGGFKVSAAAAAPGSVALPAAAATAASSGGFKAPAPAGGGGGGFKAPAATGGGSFRAPASTAAAAGVGVKAGTSSAQEARYFQVLYTKYQPGKKLRKNKSWLDGILEIRADKKTVLYDPEGKVISQSALRGVSAEGLGSGSELVLGSFEMEIDSVLGADKFRTGEAFLKPSTSTAAVLLAAPGASHGLKPLAPSAGFKPVMGGGFKPVAGSKLPGPGAAGEQAKASTWLHDPHAEGAVVLNRQQWDNGNGCDRNGRLISPVVIDPYMSKHLRQHQIEGVTFMYECVMGLKESSGLGCILADEMGLGKTLQVLTLVWTLLKQGPQGRPAVRKALVVTPSTLTQNWADEARKWLGNERLRVMVLQPGADGKQQVVDFKFGQVMPVMVTSYETLRKHAADLAGTIDLLVCDEGHRLKSAQGNKTITALTSLNCARRILLTGTPIQNNLQEFFAMADFVNPDVLGSLSTFERVFGAPIAKSRDRNASAEEKVLGEVRSAELAKRVAAFVLRRTADINAKYLPPLALYVVFCRPSPLQLRLYSSVLGSSSVRKMLSTTGADFGDQALTVLTNLKKICNHPNLYSMDEETRLRLHVHDEPGMGPNEPMDPQHSGKMAALDVVLHESLAVARDRLVVVSQSTAALDLVQQLCDARGYKTVRIDGATDVTKRQDIVNSFNNYNVGQVFLLSTTAGGAGLNLVGANRLVLLDSHWNPAMDLQAMARIWRDGQKKPCVVYRLLTTGTIDEKMYQRQRMKGDIAATMMDKKGTAGGKAQGKGQFSKEELRKLFTLNTDTNCDTFDILQGTKTATEFKDVSGAVADGPLEAAVAAGHVTFVHHEKKELSEACTGQAGVGGPGGADEGAEDEEEEGEEQIVVVEGEGRSGGQQAQQQAQQQKYRGMGDDDSDELEIEDDDTWAC